MGAFNLRSLALLLLSVTLAAADDLQRLLNDTTTVRSFDWEWVLIQVLGVDGSLAGADVFSAADSQVIVTAVDAIEPDVQTDLPLSTFESLVQYDTDTPRWFETGMVAFRNGSVTHLDVVLKDVDEVEGILDGDDHQLEARVVLPTVFDEWVELSPKSKDGDFTLRLLIRRSKTPVSTEAQQEQMNLTEVVLDLEDGSKASLVHSIAPARANNKAVLYLPGRTDSFAHPNVLDMYQEKGYDFYSLDPRACGRARRFMNASDVFLGHVIDSFDTYKEEVDLTLDFIREQGNYTQLFLHCHSTGALVGLNYAMLVEGEPFDGYVLNGPFLDWGFDVGGDLKEFLLDNAGKLEWLGLSTLSTVDALSSFHTKNWIINRWNTTGRPLWPGHVTTGWAQAVTDVHNKILAKSNSDPITSTPVLFIASLGDTTLETSESEKRIPRVAANYSQALLNHNAHDVTQSRTQHMNVEAIAVIAKWLDDPEEEFMMGDAVAPPLELSLDWTIMVYPQGVAQVGDTLTFNWLGEHNVYVHPSGDCTMDGAILIGEESGASHTFTADQVGEITFACDIYNGAHCGAGQIITYVVIDASSTVDNAANMVEELITEPEAMEEDGEGEGDGNAGSSSSISKQGDEESSKEPVSSAAATTLMGAVATFVAMFVL